MRIHINDKDREQPYDYKSSQIKDDIFSSEDFGQSRACTKEEIDALMEIELADEKSIPKSQNLCVKDFDFTEVSWHSIDELFSDNLNKVFNYMSSYEEYYGYTKEFDVKIFGKTNLNESVYYISQDINQYKKALELYIPRRTALYVLKSVYNKHQLDSYSNTLIKDFFEKVITDTSHDLIDFPLNHHGHKLSWKNTAPKFKKCKAECNVVMISLGQFKFDLYYKYSDDFELLIGSALKYS